MQTVATYNPLMKDFPLEQLLSATELDRIRDALVIIFTHLKKIKLSQYPIQRCLRLIEAISKDLMSQILKVLGTRKLVLMNFDEFEKVRTRELDPSQFFLYCCIANDEFYLSSFRAEFVMIKSKF